MSTLTLRVPDQLARELERVSKRRKVAKSDVAREAIERYLRVQRLEDVRARLVPQAQAQGVFGDEDVFRKLGLDVE